MNQDLNATMGGRTRSAREARGLTPAQLGSRLGIMTNTINNWEADRSEPRVNKLLRLAGILGVSVVWLATGEVPEDSKKMANHETANLSSKIDQLQALQEQVSVLTLEVQDEVVRLQNRIDSEEL